MYSVLFRKMRNFHFFLLMMCVLYHVDSLSSVEKMQCTKWPHNSHHPSKPLGFNNSICPIKPIIVYGGTSRAIVYTLCCTCGVVICSGTLSRAVVVLAEKKILFLTIWNKYTLKDPSMLEKRRWILLFGWTQN